MTLPMEDCTILFRQDILSKLEYRNFTLDKLREMDPKEIGDFIRNQRAGADVKRAAMEIPMVEVCEY